MKTKFLFIVMVLTLGIGWMHEAKAQQETADVYEYICDVMYDGKTNKITMTASHYESCPINYRTTYYVYSSDTSSVNYMHTSEETMALWPVLVNAQINHLKCDINAYAGTSSTFGTLYKNAIITIMFKR